MAVFDLIEKDIIKIPMDATNKDEAMTELVNILFSAGKIENVETTLSSVWERENQGSTGLGQGIAIPHAKVDGIESIKIAIGIAPEGIDFDALDGELSQIFFLLIGSPDQPSLHVEALTEIASLVKSAASRRLLLAAESAEEVVEIIKE